MTPLDREGFVEIRSCVVEGEPHACTVWFKVGVQEFCITPIACEDRNTAEWFKRMFLKAIDSILAAERERCAKIAEQSTDGVHRVFCTNIAAAIRIGKEGP